MQSIDMRNVVGRTPLSAPATHGRLNVVNQYVSAEVNMNILDNDGKIAFARILGHRTSKKFHIDAEYEDALKIYEELLQIQEQTLGCDHWETNKTRDHIGKLRSLIYLMGLSDTKPPSFMKNMEAKNDKGKTPLHAAAKSGKLPFVKILVGVGVNVNILDNDGKTAFDLGKTHVEVASFLGHKMSEKFQEEKKYEGALKILEELLTIQEEILGTGHPETAQTQNNIRSLYALLYAIHSRHILDI